MEAILLVFLLALPVTMLVWTLRFKGYFALLSVPPLLILFAVFMIFNTSFDEEHPPHLNYTSNLPVSFNHTSSNGSVFTEVSYLPITTTYVIGFFNMQILSVLFSTFLLSVAFLIFLRVAKTKGEESG